MLVMFGLGVGSLAWMSLLAGVMLLERTALRGRAVVPVVGAALLGYGLLLCWRSLWPPAAASPGA